MKNKKHLPGKFHLSLYGVGPVYGTVIIAVTVAAVIAGHSALFEKGMFMGMRIPSAMIGILLIIIGLYLWHDAVFHGC